MEVMKVRGITIYLTFLLCSNILYGNIADSLRTATNTSKSEILLIFHFNITGCVKCYIEPNEIISNLERNKHTMKCKIVASVLCDRDIELKIFSKSQKWKFGLLRNDGNLLQQLNATNEHFLTIITTDNKLINLKPGNPEQNYNKIVNIIN